MKYLLPLFWVLPFILQSQSVYENLLIAKERFINTDREQIENIEKIEKLKGIKQLFEQVLRDTPQCSEAHYYYGYTLDRLYSLSIEPNIRDMISNVNRQNTEKISAEFEWILKNDTIYKGQKYILNPAGKLTSIWGSLALKYLKDSKKDSAQWAFTEGRQRGGFSDVNLSFAKNLLQSCPQNTILFTWGDNDTYPLWYLQYSENFRTDVAVLNLSLLQTNWFIKLSQKEWGVPYGKTDAEIDLIPDYFENYDTKQVTIKTEATEPQKSERFTWSVLPSQPGYLIRDDYIISELVKNNRFRRPICYSLSTQTEKRKVFIKHLVYRGLVVHIVPNAQSNLDAQSLSNLKDLDASILKKPETKQDDDNIVFTSTFQYAFLTPIQEAILKRNKQKALEYLSLTESKLPESEWADDSRFIDYLNYLKKEIKNLD